MTIVGRKKEDKMAGDCLVQKERATGCNKRLQLKDKTACLLKNRVRLSFLIEHKILKQNC